MGLFEQARLDAGGATGSGTVLVGGDWQGKDTLSGSDAGTVSMAGATVTTSTTDDEKRKRQLQLLRQPQDPQSAFQQQIQL